MFCRCFAGSEVWAGFECSPIRTATLNSFRTATHLCHWIKSNRPQTSLPKPKPKPLSNWKRNCITGALHRAKRISTDFDKDIKTLETSFINARYPKRFISHTINNFLNDSSEDDNFIPNFLFEKRKKFFIKLPFCGKNEKLSKTFIEKLNKFTNFNFIFVIL